MALTDGDLKKIGSIVDNKLERRFKEFGREFDKKLVKQKVEIRNEWYDLFAEAFQGMINPMFKALGKDIRMIKNDVGGMKKDIQGLRYSVDTIEHRLDKFDDRIWEQQESIKRLEKIHPSGQHALA